MRRRHFVYGDEVDPRSLRERDELLEKVPLGVWDAFLELSSSRQLGAMGGAGHIPHSEFLAWSEIAGLRDPVARRGWWALIRVLDGEYVRHMNKKEEPSE